jgi:DNA-binding PadR family transcriptional regulator
MAREKNYFWGPRHAPPFQKGDLKYIILDLINEKPRYGYEIIQVLKEISHGFYAPSPGTIYPTLQLLVDMDQLSYKQHDSKKVYSITDEGRKFLAENEEYAEETKRQMKRYWNPDDMKQIGKMMRAFGRLRQLIRQARKSDAKTISSIQDIISETYDKIEDILK